MSKGKNPNRPPASQVNHDKIIRYIANNLVSNYTVRADHINWPSGSPSEINGYIPDITATDGKSFFIIEVETCPTYGDNHTKDQLTAFNKATGTTYIIVPITCERNGKNYDPVPEVKQVLKSWGLTNVKVGTCDLSTGKINYNV